MNNENDLICHDGAPLRALWSGRAKDGTIHEAWTHGDHGFYLRWDPTGKKVLARAPIEGTLPPADKVRQMLGAYNANRAVA